MKKHPSTGGSRVPRHLRHLVLLALVLCLLLRAAPAGAQGVTPTGACFFRTNGASVAPDQGDWYTTAPSASTRRAHVLYVDVPVAAAFPVTVTVLDAEETANPGVDRGDLDGLAPSDPSRFVLYSPTGA